MTHSLRSPWVVMIALLGLAAAATAQTPTDTTTATANPPPAATSPPPAPKGPSPETVKKAKEAGYRAKLHRGVTVFCKEEVEIGTHFSTESCINENQLALVLDRQQAQRDSLSNHTCSAGGACSGK